MKNRQINNLALSREIKVTHVTIKNYLAGNCVRSDHLAALADFFGVSTDEILGRSALKYPEIQPQAMVVHDATTKKQFAKLREQAHKLQEQVNTIVETIKELES